MRDLCEVYEADEPGDRVALADGPARPHVPAEAWVAEAMGLGEALGVGELLALGDGYLEGVGEAGVDQVVVDQSGEGQPDHDGPGMIICSALPGPALPPEPTRHQVLDVVVLVALLAVCAGVYRAVGNAGFSVITGAVAGLYGTWRIRR